jgi:hypothetical protein
VAGQAPVQTGGEHGSAGPYPGSKHR